MVRGEIVTEANHLLAQEFVAEAKVLDNRRRHDPVGDGKQRSFAGAQPSGAESDVFDNPNLIVDLADVPYLNDFVKKYRDSAEHVFKRFLGAQAQGERSDSHAGQCGGNVKSQAVQHQQSYEYEYRHFYKTPHQRHDRTLCVHPATRQAALRSARR